ncbi:MAG: cobalt-precorrin-5B (C(1))-methyltransferase [Proteobacteria bacterium]|nr:cobalt-precorrin-5B (C(1))-methyltransferase [Pseudomonadota bacterium]
MQKQPTDKALRSGFTTGACAAAAAKAASRFFITGSQQDAVESILPNRQKVRFALARCHWDGEFALSSIIKDGGDDPDCTHGAEIIARVRLRQQSGLKIYGGQGIAMVTKPGLGLEVGSSAINPVPRLNIAEMVNLEIADSMYHGADIEISCPDGEERAKKTLNARLGLLGGISILGTTGIVLPYSTAAFIASIVQAIQLAEVEGSPALVFTTGGRSEQYAMKLLPHLTESSFIQVGDYVGIALRNAVRCAFKEVYIVGMMGKLSKMADGRMMTHASASEVNMELLASIAEKHGCASNILAEIRSANTARHVLEICQANGLGNMPSMICDLTRKVCERFAREKLAVQITMVDFDGKVLGQDTIRQGRKF